MKILIFFAATLAPMGLIAQNSPVNKPTFPLWTAPIPTTQGAYAVSLNSICSVALEKYDLKFEDKVFPITECSIETVGGKTARFYFVNEDKKQKNEKGPMEEAKAAFTPVISDLEKDEDSEENQKKLRVVKIYPESALTGTVEYRLSSAKKVADLYQNLRDAWVASAP